MNKNELRQLTAVTALNAMMSKSFFSICAVRDAGDLLNIPVRHSESYLILEALHCVDFNKMPTQLREQIPSLINDCLSCGPEFTFIVPTEKRTVELSLYFPENRPKPETPMKKFLGFLRR